MRSLCLLVFSTFCLYHFSVALPLDNLLSWSGQALNITPTDANDTITNITRHSPYLPIEKIIRGGLAILEDAIPGYTLRSVSASPLDHEGRRDLGFFKELIILAWDAPSHQYAYLRSHTDEEDHTYFSGHPYFSLPFPGHVDPYKDFSWSTNQISFSNAFGMANRRSTRSWATGMLVKPARPRGFRTPDGLWWIFDTTYSAQGGPGEERIFVGVNSGEIVTEYGPMPDENIKDGNKISLEKSIILLTPAALSMWEPPELGPRSNHKNFADENSI